MIVSTAFVVEITVVLAQIMCPQGAELSVVIPGEGDGACPSNQTLTSAREELNVLVDDALLTLRPQCGSRGWTQVVSLNMADTSQQCPSPWEEYSSPVRSCSRPSTAGEVCTLVSFPVNGKTYQQVCGRVTGYRQGNPDGFDTHGTRNDENYVDGVTIAHSASREHIWTFAATIESGIYCPCSVAHITSPPSFVPSTNYFCDSSQNGALWDGEDCLNTPASACCQVNSPPWFSVLLPQPTSDAIDVRICGDEAASNENPLIQSMEIYVQ